MISGGQSVFVLTGQGDGRFEVTWSGAAGENPVDLAIADLDGDGLADRILLLLRRSPSDRARWKDRGRQTRGREGTRQDAGNKPY